MKKIFLLILPMLVSFYSYSGNIGTGELMGDIDKQNDQVNKTVAEKDARRKKNFDEAKRNRGNIISPLNYAFYGKCDVYHDIGQYLATYSNGETGYVYLRCSDGCWHINEFAGGAFANNCGDFQNGTWFIGNGRYYYKNGYQEITVGNIVKAALN